MLRRWFLTLCLLGLIVSALTACGPRNKPDPTALPYTPQAVNTSPPNKDVTGDSTDGAMVFEQNCVSCHSIEEDVNIAGPSLFQAGESLSYDYIKQSIANPHEVVVEVINPEFEEAVMPTNFFQIFTEQEIEDVIAYVLSLKVISPTSAGPSG